MSDYPMLISNKLHSFRNFNLQTYEKLFTLKEKKDEKYRNLSENAKLS